MTSHPFRIPMRLRFRGVRFRAGVLLHGPHGWGEFSPFPDYPPATAARWLAAAREAATRVWPKPVRDRIPVNAIVPAVDATTAHRLVREAGCRTVKVKVAEGDDLGRVEAVRDALGGRGRVRVDANGGWDVDTAARMIRALARFELEYVEQPVRTLEEMARLRRLVDVPLAADESIRTADDPLRVRGLEAADVLVLKAQPLGGVWPCLRIAEQTGLPVVVSSAVETSVGLAAGVALAAALPDLPFACGLGTAALLDGDVTAAPLLAEDGALAVRRPLPDDALLRRWRPRQKEAAALLARMAAAEAA